MRIETTNFYPEAARVARLIARTIDARRPSPEPEAPSALDEIKAAAERFEARKRGTLPAPAIEPEQSPREIARDLIDFSEALRAPIKRGAFAN